jgi:hypothetical protein
MTGGTFHAPIVDRYLVFITGLAVVGMTSRTKANQAVGSLSFESFAIKDELAPSGGNAGGAIYKFVPAIPFQGGGPITVPAQSPLASGAIFGLRVAASGSANWGQGAETGNGAWTAVNLAGAGVPLVTELRSNDLWIFAIGCP